MPLTRVIAACVLISVFLPSMAQSRKKAPTPALVAPQATPEWTREPETVLGVRLGFPLSASAVASCPTQVTASESVCLETRASTYPGAAVQYQLWGTGMANVAANLHLDDAGNVQRITLWTKQINYAELAGILKARYGAPTSEEVKDVKNRAGATFSSTELFWEGKHMTLVATERFDKIDESMVIFSDNASIQRVMDKRDAKAKDAASRL